MSFCTLEDSIGDLAWPEESEVRAITALDIEVL